MLAADLRDLLGVWVYDLTSEESIQRGIAQVLERQGVDFEREVHLSAGDRPDFMVGSVAVEVKRHGSLGPVLRQLSRYSRHERVRELLLVTSRLQSTDVPDELGGKPLEQLVLLGSVFA